MTQKMEFGEKDYLEDMVWGLGADKARKNPGI